MGAHTSLRNAYQLLHTSGDFLYFSSINAVIGGISNDTDADADADEDEDEDEEDGNDEDLSA